MTRPPELIVLCGLPGSGKTTVARRLAAERSVVRYCPDEWFAALELDPWDEGLRDRIEQLQLAQALGVLRGGGDVVIEWGSWGRAERDALRARAAGAGAAFVLVHLDVAPDELWRRIESRNAADDPAVPRLTREDLETSIGWFEPPTEDEQAIGVAELFDRTGASGPGAPEVGQPDTDRDAVLAYYADYDEAGRLTTDRGPGPLELARTLELLAPHLPDAPAGVLDVGGGTGVYAGRLAEMGHRVHLVDLVPDHVDAARRDGRFTVAVGDARVLDVEDGSQDVVLLLGPLYHLTTVAARTTALGEARRVLRAGGLLAVAAVSRFAALYDLLLRKDLLHLPHVLDVLTEAIPSGSFAGREHGMFTDTHHHLPSELTAEVEDAGFDDVEVHLVEGPGGFVPDFARRWSDPERREAMLRAARLADSDAEVRAATPHLLAIARAPA